MKGKKQYIVIIVILIIIIILLDQSLKLWVSISNDEITIVKGMLKIHYRENTGMAFGIGNGSLVRIITTNLLVLFILIRFLIRQIENMNNMSKISLSFILAGGISNLLDRLIKGKVIDYIDISSIINQFPIFNLADMCIVIGFIIFVITVAIDLIKLRPRK